MRTPLYAVRTPVVRTPLYAVRTPYNTAIFRAYFCKLGVSNAKSSGVLLKEVVALWRCPSIEVSLHKILQEYTSLVILPNIN